MKWIFVCAVLLTAFNSCKKEKTKQPLVGKWELRYIKGGMAVSGQLFYPSGNGSTITFGDSLYEYHKMNRLIFRGTYTITRSYCYATGRDMNAYVIGNGKTF